MTHEQEIIWAAGLIDGEGSIYITRNGKVSQVLYIQIVMTHKPTVEKIRRIFDCGQLNRILKKIDKTAWNWRCTGQNAENVIRKILPFLTTKRDEAVLALKYRDAQKEYAYRRSLEWKELQLQFNREMKELKKYRFDE